MKRIIFYLLTFLFLNHQYCQDTTFFDKDWKNCTKYDAEYYRTITPSNGLYEIKDFYISNILQMKGYSSAKDSLYRQGEFEYYNKHGVKIESIPYVDNVKHGKSFQYFDNGKLKRVTNFINGDFNGETIYYNSNGVLIGKGLAKDNYWFGKWEKYRDDGSFSTYLYYDDKFHFPEINVESSTPEYIWIYFEKVENDSTIKYLCRPVNSKREPLEKYSQAPDVYLLIPKYPEKYETLSPDTAITNFKILDTLLQVSNVEVISHVPIQNQPFTYYYIDVTSKIKDFQITIVIKEDRLGFYKNIIEDFILNLHLID